MSRSSRISPTARTIVNLQGIPGDKTMIDRNAGAHEGLDVAGDSYVFVARQPADFSRDQGLSVTENILTGLSETPRRHHRRQRRYGAGRRTGGRSPWTDW